MNKYIKNLNRIEFLITLACTGRCKHCSEGDHAAKGESIDAAVAAHTVKRLCEKFSIGSVMTFGGEPLLKPEAVYSIHSAAAEMNVPIRQLITNGFFSKDAARIQTTARALAECGVNKVLLSVDAFHQETIPLEPVKCFAEEIKKTGINVKAHPAWIVGKDGNNPYDMRTAEILEEFEQMGILSSKGNIIFPDGNALKFLGEYFDSTKEYKSPYKEDPEDIRSICVSPDGGVLGENIYQMDILDIVENYKPAKG